MVRIGWVLRAFEWLHSLYISGLLDSISMRGEDKEGCYLQKTYDVPDSCICHVPWADWTQWAPLPWGLQWVAVRWWLGLESSEMTSSSLVWDSWDSKMVPELPPPTTSFHPSIYSLHTWLPWASLHHNGLREVRPLTWWIASPRPNLPKTKMSAEWIPVP